jgi:hypothetical protein
MPHGHGGERCQCRPARDCMTRCTCMLLQSGPR